MLTPNYKRIILFSATLVIATSVSAALDDLNLFYQEDTKDKMVWPLLPNESLTQLATKFYPNNQAMQRKFIVKTLQLNKNEQPIENAKASSSTIRSIIIPNLESLSATAGTIKRSTKKDDSKELRLSYNIKSTAEKAKETFQNIPARMLREYEELIVKNTFLKEEIEKLNKRLVFLQSKLGELKLVLDRTLTLPKAKKSLKNLDTEKAKVKTKIKTQAKVDNKPVNQVVEPEADTNAGLLGYLTNKFLWLAIAVFGLIFFVLSQLYKKYQERKYKELVNSISQQNQVRTFTIDDPEGDYAESALQSTTLNKDTQVEEHDSEAVLKEAKLLMAQNSTEDAIEHLKWTIKAKPKVGINVWLYLLDVLRKQNLKDEFEKYAYQMHQNFNVMTPLWEEREVAMVVAQSLEDFPYIIKFLTDKWPNEKIIKYLEKLINDNRSGERSGFSKPVIEEILLLIVVLKARQYL